MALGVQLRCGELRHDSARATSWLLMRELQASKICTKTKGCPTCDENLRIVEAGILGG